MTLRQTTPFYFDNAQQANKSDTVHNYDISLRLKRPPKYELEDHMPSSASAVNSALYWKPPSGVPKSTSAALKRVDVDSHVSVASIRGNKNAQKVPDYEHRSVKRSRKKLYKINWQHYGNIRGESEHGNKLVIESISRGMTFTPNKLSLETVSSSRVKGYDRDTNRVLSLQNLKNVPYSADVPLHQSSDTRVNGQLVGTAPAFIAAS